MTFLILALIWLSMCVQTSEKSVEHHAFRHTRTAAYPFTSHEFLHTGRSSAIYSPACMTFGSWVILAGFMGVNLANNKSEVLISIRHLSIFWLFTQSTVYMYMLHVLHNL